MLISEHVFRIEEGLKNIFRPKVETLFFSPRPSWQTSSEKGSRKKPSSGQTVGDRASGLSDGFFGSPFRIQWYPQNLSTTVSSCTLHVYLLFTHDIYLPRFASNKKNSFTILYKTLFAATLYFECILVGRTLNELRLHFSWPAPKVSGEIPLKFNGWTYRHANDTSV